MSLPLHYFFGPHGPGEVPPENWDWHDHHGHHHHHHDCCGDHCADDCDDQLPAIANVGRGLQGDSFYVTIDDPDTCVETYLHGWRKDSVTGVMTKEWDSLNINGGELYYQYNLRPYTNPQTFTITFIYRRPTRCEWSWTTPAIPYIWDANKDGDPDVDDIIGSGVGDLYIRTANREYPDIINGKNPKDDAWIEKLVFPPGTTAIDYNSPKPLEPWSVNLTFGLVGGDVLVPNIYDLAAILGFPATNLWNVCNGSKGQFKGGVFNQTGNTLKDYLDANDQALLDHFHSDLGFPDGFFPNDGGKHPNPGMTVYEYIDKRFKDLNFDFDINNTIVVQERNVGTFNNKTGHSWFSKWNGSNCGTARVVYGYSAELRLCELRIDYNSGGFLPLPFGIGCEDPFTLCTLPKELWPDKEIRNEIDVPSGSVQRLWVVITRSGQVQLHGVTNFNLISTLLNQNDRLKSAFSSLGYSGYSMSEDELYGAVYETPWWDCTALISYFYSLKS